MKALWIGAIVGLLLGATATRAQISGGGGATGGGGGVVGGSCTTGAATISISASGVPTCSAFATPSDLANALAAAAVSSSASQSTFLVSGGQVVWTSNYTYLVSAATYYIGGVLYNSPQTSITLTAADMTNDRLDIIAVNSSSAVVKIDGTAASQPVEPDVDPSTQLKLALVLVTHNTSAPPATVSTLVYDENAGPSTEWTTASSGTGWSLASTSNPYNGTKDIEATSVASGAYFTSTIGSSSINPNTYSFLTFYVRSKASWSSKTLQIRLYNSSGAVVGKTLTLGQGAYGFDSTNTTSYQQIAIPTSQFGVASGVAVTKIQFTRAGSGTIGFYLDYMQWLGANGNQGTIQSTHNILSSTHSDTVAANVVRGDLIVGNSTPAWNRLALCSTGKFIGSNGTDTLCIAPTAGVRVVTASDATSVTPNSDSADMTYQLNTQGAGTLTINADGGTPVNGQKWMFKIKSSSVQTFSWSSSANGFLGGTVALPTATTGSSKVDYYGFTFDGISGKWHYTGLAAGF